MTELNGTILNTGHRFKRPLRALNLEILRHRKLVQAGGGTFVSDLGRCEAKIMKGPGHAVIALKVEGRGVALAALAVAAFGSDIVWNVLYEQHANMMRALKRPLPDPKLEDSSPSVAPWLGISLEPSFLDTASKTTTDQIVTLLMEFSQALLN